jgi:adenylate kinase
MKTEDSTIVILIGPPGCGKGTQGEILSEKLGNITISTGNLLRDEMKSQTSLGKKLRTTMCTGKLVDDQIVLNLLKAKILTEICSDGFILDGFPRNIKQANELEELLDTLRKSFKLVAIDVSVSDKKIINRIVNRYYCTECKTNYNKLYKNPIKKNICDVCGSEGKFAVREDDTEEIVRKRLKEYNKQTAPVISYYKKKGVLLKVNGDEAVDKVSHEIDSKLKKILTY